MNEQEELEFVKHMQEVAQIMKENDIEENPGSAYNEFQCDCCAKIAPEAGSILYGDKHFCNECMMYAEIAMALGKAKDADEIIKLMEDKRLEELCDYVKMQEVMKNNL